VTAPVGGLATRRPRLLAFGLVAAHVALAVLLVMVALSVSLAIGGPGIGRDELYRLGPALPLAVAGALVPVPVAATAALALALSAQPQRAWTAPVIGGIASVALCGVALAFVHTPAPLIGG
jgi:hypothetical protein